MNIPISKGIGLLFLIPYIRKLLEVNEKIKTQNNKNELSTHASEKLCGL